MFENLELVRTVLASGGREACSTARTCCGAPRPRGTSGRSACVRRTTRSRGPRASSCSSRCFRSCSTLAITGHWLALAGAALLRAWPPRSGEGAKADARVPREHAALRPALARRTRRVQLARARRAHRSRRRALSRDDSPSRRYTDARAAGALRALRESGAPARTHQLRKHPTSIGLNVPLFDSSAEHAVTPTIISISARSTM